MLEPRFGLYVVDLNPGGFGNQLTMTGKPEIDQGRPCGQPMRNKTINQGGIILNVVNLPDYIVTRRQIFQGGVNRRNTCTEGGQNKMVVFSFLHHTLSAEWH
jgi:hypothetical protein